MASKSKVRVFISAPVAEVTKTVEEDDLLELADATPKTCS